MKNSTIHKNYPVSFPEVNPKLPCVRGVGSWMTTPLMVHRALWWGYMVTWPALFFTWQCSNWMPGPSRTVKHRIHNEELGNVQYMYYTVHCLPTTFSTMLPCMLGPSRTGKRTIHVSCEAPSAYYFLHHASLYAGAVQDCQT